MVDFVAPCTVRSKADIGRAWLVCLVWSGLVVDEGALLQDQMRRAEEMRQMLRSVDCYALLKESRSFLWLQRMYACDKHRGCGRFCRADMDMA